MSNNPKDNMTSDEHYKRGYDDALAKFKHVYTTADGAKLYTDSDDELCNCDGSWHKLGIGCL